MTGDGNITLADLEKMGIPVSGPVHSIDSTKGLTPENMVQDRPPVLPPPPTRTDTLSGLASTVMARMSLYEANMAKLLSQVRQAMTEKDVIGLIARYAPKPVDPPPPMPPQVPVQIKYDTGTYTLQYSIDGGVTWLPIDVTVEGVVPS